MKNHSDTTPDAKKEYQTPVLKTFGKVGDITKFNNDGSGFINDGGGTPSYTS